MNIVQEKWPEIIEHLRIEHELSNVSFTTWIQPLKVYDVIDNTVFILVNMNASVEYIEKKYLLPLKVCIAEITGTEFEVMFISEDDDKLDEIQNMAIEASQKKKTKSAAEKAGLNPKYTFDTFVVGGNNNFCPRCLPCCCRISWRSIQSIISIWRRRTWQNASYAFHRSLHIR